ncbi:MAG TPA: PilC/PilY family type IV pilus protein [Usitatibacter sp.]|nr:PilC/PilY family type IV pilus protein [Usitatibacter sp.]
MKKPILRLSLASTAIAAALCGPVGAEDIDLFVGTNASATNPNVVIMIDNSANWDANNQHWPFGKQGESELRALGRAATEVKDGSINLGLMLFTPGVGSTPNGAYVRFHVSTLTPAIKTALQQQIGVNAAGADFCVPGNNSLTGSPNCILQNFSSPGEKVGTAKLDYSAGLFEVFKYFGGFADPAHAINDSPGGPSGYAGESPRDASHFGPFRYARNGGAAEPYSDPRAYNGASKTGYNPPYNPDGTGSCARNYLVFIGNGFPNSDAPSTLLSGVRGNTTQLKMPTFNVQVDPQRIQVGTQASCMSKAQCMAAAQAGFPNFDSWDCTGGTGIPNTPLGTDATCHTNAQCVTYAQTTFPGHTTYVCSGGTAGPGASGTDLKCETVASCATSTAPAMFPGYTGYACSGGTQSTTATTNLGTDTVTESVAACKVRAASLYPGYASYDCTGGTIVTTTPGTVLSPTCESAANCLLNAPTRFPGHDTYVSCTGGTGCAGGNKKDQTLSFSDIKKSGLAMKGIGCSGTRFTGMTVTANSTCRVNQTMTATDSCLVGQAMFGLKNVNVVTPTGLFDTPASNAVNYADEWAKYLNSTDVNGVAGQQTVQTYTIDVFKDAQDANESALLYSMAKYGGGRYFQAKDENSILDALRDILSEIQAVNTVFASASLPINATNRSQNENQVFIGMFRPDNKGRPRWYGNLKHYKVALFSGDARLADSLDQEAIAATTGFVQACAQSFYTTDSDIPASAGPPATPLTHYWEFSPISAGRCTSKPNNSFNDLPDGGVVEKGGAAEVLRRGNAPGAPTWAVNRTMLTCDAAPCVGLTPFNTTSVTPSRTGAATAAANQTIVEYTKGTDWLDENNNANSAETRPTIHGDIAHSRPLPVNFGGTRGVEVYYGSNDGAFHAMRGSDGKELWSFIAPEHHSKLKRLYDNAPSIAYPGTTGTLPKDYFFDGSAGLYQNADSSRVWVFPTMRRGGRMIYAFDISRTGDPTFKWAKGCPDIVGDSGCTASMSDIGLTWSVPNAAFIRGYASGTDPVLIVGGGYDLCEDADVAVTACTTISKGHKVYVLNADTGVVIASFDTEGSVPSDVTLIDRDFDGKVDHGYVVDTRGNLYRIDFVDPVTLTSRTSGAWTITKIAQTTTGNRKFLFGPAALSTGPITYLSFGSGDRERPLIKNYPYVTPIQNRFYMFTDKFQTTGLPVDLDGSNMTNNSNDTGCSDQFDTSKSGWFMDLKAGTGEQTVTSSVIFGGTVFFSTNRPISTADNSCATNLGEARGYAVNLLNASGVIGTGQLCGGSRSGIFTGGGLPPSPVVGTVPVRQPDGSDKPISVLIGGINLDTGTGSPIGAQEPPVPIKQIRSRVYWYKHGDK